jgi:hypothetical protein
MKRYLALLAGLVACSAQAWDCKYEKEIDLELDLEGSQNLTVRAQAGDLSVRGRPDLSSARISAKVCSSTEEWLDESEIVMRKGKHAEIVSVLPRIDTGWSLTGNRYLYMDLEIEVPSSIALVLNDSSGDIEVENTAALSIKDSSGDIEIEQASGAVVLRDSSGDIELSDITGDVTVEVDSSGDIYGNRIEGSVIVVKDSSGDIRFRQVEEDFTVERDSSGDIVADSVGGDFRVLRDGSGEIRMNGVAGAVDIPEKG